jgi:hypothetical protein
MANTKTKVITINKNKFTLEVYPAREGSTGKEGPYWEIFAHDYNGCLYAFSNKEKLNEHIRKKFIN